MNALNELYVKLRSIEKNYQDNGITNIKTQSRSPKRTVSRSPKRTVRRPAKRTVSRSL